MRNPKDPLANIVYVSLGEELAESVNGLHFDPSVRLPVEIPPDQTEWNTKDLKWEEIISAMLKILAYNHQHPDAAYYRQFILSVKPDLKVELTEAAIIKARNRDVQMAIEILKALEGLFPECALTKLNLALVYEQTGHQFESAGQETLAEEYFELAFNRYRDSIDADSELAETHFNFAKFHVHQKNFERAKEYFKLFLKTAPEHKQARIARSIIRQIDSHGLAERRFKEAFDAIKTGREEEGLQRIDSFLQDHTDVWNAWFLRGWGLRRLARYDEAREAFETSLRLNASHPDTLNELAICLMELGQYDRSYQCLTKALRLESDNTKIISNLGILSLKQGKTDEARSFFRTVLELDREDPLAKRYLDLLG